MATSLFWLFSALAIFAAVMVVTSRLAIYSILWLVVLFFTISGHYILMNAQFLAIVNIIVYAGAIMVLFLFVVMLMNVNDPNDNKKSIGLAIFGGLATILFLLSILNIVFNAQHTTKEINDLATTSTGDIGLVQNLGMELFKNYVLPFEICGVLFLSAIIGAVTLGKR
ncbi:MAG: NADH-quinone oxidoreductase subunit J [Phycisphaerales bacterium]|nr:NADH-quinone oxidoreductase subunit J [Phycisphaerales bacterium]